MSTFQYNFVESDEVCRFEKSNSTFYHRIGSSLVTLCSASKCNMIDRHHVTHHSLNAVLVQSPTAQLNSIQY